MDTGRQESEDLKELNELMEIIFHVVDESVNGCLEKLGLIWSVENALEQIVMNLEDKSKSKQIIGLTYEETLELRLRILQGYKKGLDHVELFVEQFLTNLEAPLKKIVENGYLFGLLCLILLARNDHRGFEKIEARAFRTLNNLLFGEEDTKAFVIAKELAEILPVSPPKIKALQFFPNRVRKAISKIIGKRYPLPGVPVTFVRSVSDIPDKKERTVEFIKKKDAKKEVDIIITEYLTTLSPQAKSQRGLGKFLREKLNSGEIDEYLKRTESGFRIDTTRIQQESGKPLRTVERFLEGLTKFCQQKPSFDS